MLGFVIIGVLAMIGGYVSAGVFFIAIAALIYFVRRKKEQHLE